MRMEQSHVSVYCDMSLMLTYKAIFSTATAVSQQINARFQRQLSGNYTDREDQILVQPLAVDEVQIFNTTGGYGNFILPPVLMLILQQTLLLGIGLSAGTARENNRYQDLVPISRHYNGIFRIVGGKSLCYFMIYSILAAYICLVVPRLFHFTTLADIRELTGLLIPYLLACIFFGMFVSCIVRYRENVILLIVFTSVPLLFLTGVSWPQSAIPEPGKASPGSSPAPLAVAPLSVSTPWMPPSMTSVPSIKPFGYKSLSISLPPALFTVTNSCTPAVMPSIVSKR